MTLRSLLAKNFHSGIDRLDRGGGGSFATIVQGDKKKCE